MRDRQQVNIGKDQHFTHTQQQKAGVMRLHFFMSRRPSATRPIFQCPQPSWGHWKGPAMLGLELQLQLIKIKQACGVKKNREKNVTRRRFGIIEKM
jgi:hypothetical protein